LLFQVGPWEPLNLPGWGLLEVFPINGKVEHLLEDIEISIYPGL